MGPGEGRVTTLCLIIAAHETLFVHCYPRGFVELGMFLTVRAEWALCNHSYVKLPESDIVTAKHSRGFLRLTTIIHCFVNKTHSQYTAQSALWSTSGWWIRQYVKGNTYDIIISVNTIYIVYGGWIWLIWLDWVGLISVGLNRISLVRLYRIGLSGMDWTEWIGWYWVKEWVRMGGQSHHSCWSTTCFRFLVNTCLVCDY